MYKVRYLFAFSVMILFSNLSLAQKVSFKIITQESLQILNLNGDDTLNYIRLGPSSSVRDIELSVADVKDYFKFQIIGSSSIRFVEMTTHVGRSVTVLYGAEIRAATFLPNGIGHKYHDDRTFTLSSKDTYTFTLRMPFSEYANNNKTHIQDWSTAIIVKGRAQRYGRLRLDYINFGKENTLFAHYLPIRPEYILDSMVFYLTGDLIENVRIQQSTGRSCFIVKEVIVIDRDRFDKKGFGIDYGGEELGITINAEDNCLHPEKASSIMIKFPEKVSYLKLYIIIISGILLFFITRFVLMREDIFNKLLFIKVDDEI